MLVENQMTTKQHPIARYTEICKWAGLPIRTMTPLDVFQAGGQIIGKTSEQRHATGKSTIELLQAMSSEELRELRSSIDWNETLAALQKMK